MSRSWEELVTEGRRAVDELDDHRWTLGDLAIEATTVGDGYHDGSTEVLATYATEIGLAPDTLRKYRDIATTFQSGMRVPDASWTHHRTAAASDDPEGWVRKAADNGWSVNELRSAMGKPRQTNEPPKTPDEKASVVREYLEDDDVADEVVRDPNTADRLEGALEKNAPRPTPKPERGQTRESAALNLISDLRSIHRTIERVATSVTKGEAVVTPKMADAIVEEVRWLRNALDLIESGVQAGSLDSALTRLIEESS